MNIYVCSLDAVSHMILRERPSHLVTLINADGMIGTPKGISPENHLRLAMNDITLPMDGLSLPGAQQVENLLQFVQNWERDAPMLIHCWAGISRSTAAAFVALCALNPQIDESLIAAYLRSVSATATPNPRIVSLADQALQRENRMVEAVRAIGRGAMASEGAPFSLPSDMSATIPAR